MSKLDKRLKKLKERYDLNPRLIAEQKYAQRKIGGYFIGDKNAFTIANRSDIFVGGPNNQK